MGFHIQLRVNLVKSRKQISKHQNQGYQRKKHKCQIVRVPNCLGAEISHTGAELSGCRTVLAPKCLTQVPKCPGAELSRCRSV